MSKTEKPKQETLEDVAERLYPYEIGYGVYDRNCEIDFERERFIEGAKWQQEPEQFFNDDRIKTLEKGMEYLFKKQKRMYDEKEVLKLLIKFSDDSTFIKKNTVIRWFKLNKK